MADNGKERREWSAADVDDAAAAKLWGVYVTEAEKYDEGLVDSWKKDMEGLLIFAALFSAILTAFIIESYKSLSPDDTVQVLSQISQQLAAAAGGKPFDISPPPTFTPSASSIVCNALWFISLGLSLACALIATLVQQWARDFLHKTKLRSAPALRAPIFAYFYGLRRFGMHRMVEIIPLLLHLSLILFFAGLVEFLIPVNHTLFFIAWVMFAILGGIYLVLTLLPLRWLDCPYHTPLSATLWTILSGLRGTYKSAKTWPTWCCTWLARVHRVQCKDLESACIHPAQIVSIPLADIPTGSVPAPTPAPAAPAPMPVPTVPPQADSSVGRKSVGSVRPHPRHDTMIKAMFDAAMEHSEGHKEREYKALVWTMGSLADNSELEPFIQAIVDVLEEPHGRRPTYEEHIRRLIRESNTHLLDRIANLLDSCTTPFLFPEAIKQRRITCYKALWLIASLLTKPGEAVDFGYIYIRPSFHFEEHYCISARAMMAHSTLIAVTAQIWTDSTWKQISSKFYSHDGNDLWHYSTPAGSADALAAISSNINLQFVATAARLKSPPYRWAETHTALTRTHDSVQGIEESGLFSALYRAVSTQRDTSKPDEMAWFDESLLELLFLWPPMLKLIPQSVVDFLRRRPSESTLPDDVSLRLWSCLPRTLSEGVAFTMRKPLRADLLTAMWCAASAGRRHDNYNPSRLPILQAALKALCSTEFSPAEAQISQSIVVLLKREILPMIIWQNFPTVGEALRSLDDPLFPADTAVEIPDEIRNKGEDEEFEENMIWRDFLWDKKSEAIFYTVTEYLQHCASSTPPYKATETLKRTISLFEFAPPRRIHPAHQARFAESISRIFETEQTSQLVDAIIDQKWWLIYADGHKNDKEMKMGLKGGFCLPWLQHPGARQMIKDTFAKYEGNSKARAEKIVEGLEFWHPEETSPGAVAQSDDTAAGEPAPAGPIASSSSGGRSSEEGSEETAKYPMSLFW